MKSFIVISLVVVLNVLGDTCLSHGMREVGEVHPLHPVSVLLVGLRMITNPWVALAVTLLLADTLLYMAALSWLELSYLMPMTKLQHLLTALCAWLLLDEQITATTWAGTLTIAIGALLVDQSERKNTRRQMLQSSKYQG